MRDVTIARNYAEALLELAESHGNAEAWGELLEATAGALGTPSIEAVLMSPRVPKDQKIAIVTDALQGAPATYVLFLAAVVRRNRQMMLGKIADEYRKLVDVQLNRVRAGVTMAHEVDALSRSVIVERLAKAIGKDVIAGFSVDPALLGGIVVKVGDRVYDGSVKKRLAVLRQQLVARQ
ncbi:MAG: F0F1 ATP synthase subunit delta [Gemmatimonadales bacterium]|nr:F0F1 ATP synthase subunit delta [Gemmatimonadales bacterium]